MSYIERYSHKAFFSAKAEAADGLLDVGAASADAGELQCVVPCMVHMLQFHVTDEAIGGTTGDPTVVFTKRPTPESATAESVVGTLTLPDTTAVGKVVYTELSSPIRFEVGDALEIAHTIGTGTPTGQGMIAMQCSHCPEVPGNMTDMVASA